MHKFGHFYLPEGRKLVVAIANYINHRRYSNAPVLAQVPIINTEFLLRPLPVLLTPMMDHTTLAKAFARLVKNRSVYVYDNKVLVKGSPFSTYPSALSAIKENTRSSAIKRNIDTGKLFKGRFGFYSTPKKLSD